MYKPSTYLVNIYFPNLSTYIYETYFLQKWLPRWNYILTQFRFIHNWVTTGIQCGLLTQLIFPFKIIFVIYLIFQW
jgi:hypothetical protein